MNQIGPSRKLFLPFSDFCQGFSYELKNKVIFLKSISRTQEKSVGGELDGNIGWVMLKQEVECSEISRPEELSRVSGHLGFPL